MTGLLIRSFVKNYQDTENNQVRFSYGRLASIIGIICNVFLCIVKIAAGLLSASLSITADGLNNLSDASSNIITLIGFKLSAKPADSEHPYGHGRYEYLAGLTVCFIILFIGVELFKDSISKIITPSEVLFSWLSIIILAISIIVKLWLMVFNKKMGHSINSTALLAASSDSRNDVITTTAVLAATLISHFSSFELDGFMGAAVAAFILFSAFSLLKDTINPLLGTSPSKDMSDQIRSEILAYPKVLGTHDLMIHDYGPGRQFASVHVEMDAHENVLICHDIIDNIERDFKDNHNINMTIHYDPIVVDDDCLNQFKIWLSISIKTIHEDLSVHDVRMVPGDTHTNVIFDCYNPHPELWSSENELKNRISTLVAEKYPDYTCVITIDIGYAR